MKERLQPTSHQLLQHIADFILSAKQHHAAPLLVGIDGIDASGKTHLGNQLYQHLQQAGHPLIRSTVDNFHNPHEIRYQRGKLSPEGYYYDSFNYTVFKEYLLDPLSPNGNRQYRTAQFDHRSNAEVPSLLRTASEDAILICDGIFCSGKNCCRIGM
jgi:uridine kinase